MVHRAVVVVFGGGSDLGLEQNLALDLLKDIEWVGRLRDVKDMEWNVIREGKCSRCEDVEDAMRSLESGLEGMMDVELKKDAMEESFVDVVVVVGGKMEMIGPEHAISALKVVNWMEAFAGRKRLWVLADSPETEASGIVEEWSHILGADVTRARRSGTPLPCSKALLALNDKVLTVELRSSPSGTLIGADCGSTSVEWKESRMVVTSEGQEATDVPFLDISQSTLGEVAEKIASNVLPYRVSAYGGTYELFPISKPVKPITGQGELIAIGAFQGHCTGLGPGFMLKGLECNDAKLPPAAWSCLMRLGQKQLVISQSRERGSCLLYPLDEALLSKPVHSVDAALWAWLLERENARHTANTKRSIAPEQMAHDEGLLQHEFDQLLSRRCAAIFQSISAAQAAMLAMQSACVQDGLEPREQNKDEISSGVDNSATETTCRIGESVENATDRGYEKIRASDPMGQPHSEEIGASRIVEESRPQEESLKPPSGEKICESDSNVHSRIEEVTALLDHERASEPQPDKASILGIDCNHSLRGSDQGDASRQQPVVKPSEDREEGQIPVSEPKANSYCQEVEGPDRAQASRQVRDETHNSRIDSDSLMLGPIPDESKDAEAEGAIDAAKENAKRNPSTRIDPDDIIPHHIHDKFNGNQQVIMKPSGRTENTRERESGYRTEEYCEENFQEVDADIELAQIRHLTSNANEFASIVSPPSPARETNTKEIDKARKLDGQCLQPESSRKTPSTRSHLDDAHRAQGSRKLPFSRPRPYEESQGSTLQASYPTKRARTMLMTNQENLAPKNIHQDHMRGSGPLADIDNILPRMSPSPSPARTQTGKQNAPSYRSENCKKISIMTQHMLSLVVKDEANVRKAANHLTDLVIAYVESFKPGLLDRPIFDPTLVTEHLVANTQNVLKRLGIRIHGN